LICIDKITFFTLSIQLIIIIGSLKVFDVKHIYLKCHTYAGLQLVLKSLLTWQKLWVQNHLRELTTHLRFHKFKENRPN